MFATSKEASSLRYRPDIDGLRAVAVLLVLFNHLHASVLLTSGGYIGVDVFFVISGYLISSVILSEMASGRFSISRFYERRIRRIFPALLVVLLATSLMAYRYFVPSELEAYAKSMLAALFSVSNFLFWHQAGYFDAPSKLKPLLHTWSLGVEEQFYIIFPLFLVLVRRWFPRRMAAAIWTITVASFLLACLCVHFDATAAFFFAPLRAWELLIGTIISQKYLPAIQGAWQRNFATIAGLALILVPAFRFNAQTPFPGLYALPPCLGAALILAGGESGGSLVGSVLSWRPVVFIGLISYSLYLWHWPLLVFQDTSSMIVNRPAADKVAKFSVLIASFLIATLSWWFVETPFRKGRFRPQQRVLFLVNGTAVALIAVLGASMVACHGLPDRFPSDALSISEYTSYDPTPAFRENVCFIGPHSSFSDFRADICLRDVPGEKQYLLLGDSHAAHLYAGLATVFSNLNISQATTSSCRFFVTPVGRDCGRMSDYIFRDYLLRHRVDGVILAARWQPSDFPELDKTIAWFHQHGVPVTLIGPIVEFDAPLPRILATSIRDHKQQDLEQHRLKEPEHLDRLMKQRAKDQWKLHYISAYEDLCSTQVEDVAKSAPETPSGCPVYAAPGVPLLFDADHFTAAGATLFARAIQSRNQIP